MKDKTFNFKGFECRIIHGGYSNNRRSYLQLVDVQDGNPICMATVNIPGCKLEENEVLIKDYSENEGILECLVENKIIEDTGRVFPTGYVFANICKLLI